MAICKFSDCCSRFRRDVVVNIVVVRVFTVELPTPEVRTNASFTAERRRLLVADLLPPFVSPVTAVASSRRRGSSWREFQARRLTIGLIVVEIVSNVRKGAVSIAAGLVSDDVATEKIDHFENGIFDVGRLS